MNYYDTARALGVSKPRLKRHPINGYYVVELLNRPLDTTIRLDEHNEADWQALYESTGVKAADDMRNLIAYTEEKAFRRGALIKDPETDQPIGDPDAELEAIRINANRTKARVTHARQRGNTEQKAKGDAAQAAEERLLLEVYDLTQEIQAGAVTTEAEINTRLDAVPLN
jgi:hypothetical protein